MSSFQTRGVVLREGGAGETDKQLTILTKNYGKITAKAKGARKPRSKFMAGAQLFTYSDFIIYDGGQFYSISQVDVIDSFFAIRGDYDRLCVAQYFVEICDKTTPFNAPCDELLHLLIISLSALANGRRQPCLIARAFEAKFFQVSGVSPETSHCAKCGGELAMPVRFGAEGAVCRHCVPLAVEISPAALAAYRYVLSADLPGIFKFSANGAALSEMRNASRMFFRHHFDVEIKSFWMIH